MSEKTNAVKQRNDRYNKYVNTVTPKTSLAKAMWHSFWIGGLTCVIGQGIGDIVKAIAPTMATDTVANITSMILVSVAILFTGLGFYDVIARQGGAGSFLPITGFANAMASASMEFKTEGLIFGTSAKLFTVVGPVVVNGVVWSTVAGLLNLWIMGM
ncbi:MAG: SpoVA/SpoVAEb family sporulation membrane protein [Clostridia bacterium]|jgi:stage V sporulation protein AC|nr:SpoVA/SpoVAEb family sporulation membrane protein [Clostridia bacterium]MCI9459418.1 SpoVA/SpoVAEb family sporulation membrane protein [Clostridia bacterium]